MSTIPTIKPSGSIDTSKDLAGLLTPILETILRYIYFFTGVAALLYLIWAGYRYLSAGGDTKKSGEARVAIVHAVIGIAVIVAAYAITQFAFSLGKTVNDAASGSSVPLPTPNTDN